MIRSWLKRRRVRALVAADEDPRLVKHAALDFAAVRRVDVDLARFVVLDCETTGLDAARDRLLSIAAVGVRGGSVRLVDRYEAVVAHDDVGGAIAGPIHGMVRRDLTGGRTEADVVLDLLEHVGADVIVAHHAGFDLAILNAALGRLSKAAPAPLENAALDTGHLARRLRDGPVGGADAMVQGSAPIQSLDALAASFGLDIPHRHSAAGDALTTAYVFLALLHRAKRRGLHTVGALLAR